MAENTGYIVLAVLTVAANLAIVVADLVRAKFVIANSAEVHVPQSWLPGLAALKGAGAAGLLVGIAVPVIGVLAAAGLVLFFIGALVAHIRAGVFYNIAFPGLYLALAVATLVFALLR
jgi:DoxX-like family